MRVSSIPIWPPCILLATTAAVPAHAQAAPERPCQNAPVRTAAINAFYRSVVRPGSQPVARPVADLQAYDAAAAAAKPKDWAKLCQYRPDNQRLLALPPSERRVVYMGDSITELWGLADEAFFTHGRVNRGISGQTTGQMLVRFEADVVALHPRVVHILAGTNDLAGNEGPETLDDIRNNLTAMVALARANDIRVVLASITPAARYPWKPGIEPGPQIRELNAWLKAYAATVGATYADYYGLLVGPDGGMRPDLTFDGVHLNGGGYDRIKRLSAAATGGRRIGGDHWH